MGINLHVYPNSFRQETRILKETTSLAQAGLFDHIHIAAVWERGLDETQPLDSNRTVTRLKLWSVGWRGSAGRAARLMEWSCRVFIAFRRSRVAVVNCHALTTLPLGVLFKYTTGAKLVYDTHELETETHTSRGLRKRLAKVVERALIRYVDSVIVVSRSIENWYRATYDLREVHLVRNMPCRPDEQPVGRGRLRERLGVAPDELIFIYQGIFGSGRGIELLLGAWSQLPRSHHLVFMGNGPLQPLIEAAAGRAQNVHLHPAVPLADILDYTSAADVGIALFENTCLNYYFALPNKFYEYLFSGVPVIASDFPDMAGVIDEFQCGWKTAVNQEALVRLVCAIDRVQIAERRRGADRCRGSSGWQIEEKSMLQAYAKIVPTGPGGAYFLRL
ncbi:MAG: glycosyltransferase [Opitutae bacterium]|nr:glycosyltransferase [Opitutae bacterium]